MIITPGSDLRAVLDGKGFSSPWLWDVYGDRSGALYEGAPYGDDPNRERRIYTWAGLIAKRAITGAGSVCRTGTHYRMASAILGELASGRVWNMSKRSDECGCYRTDFRDRLHPVYRAVIDEISRECLSTSEIGEKLQAAGISESAAARMIGIPRQTLSDRIRIDRPGSYEFLTKLNGLQVRANGPVRSGRKRG